MFRAWASLFMILLLNLTLSSYILEFHFEDDASLSVTLISFLKLRGFLISDKILITEWSSRDRRFIIFVSFYITWIKTVHEVIEILKYCSKRLQINLWLAWTVCNTSIYAHLPAWLALRVDLFDVVLYYHQYICINQQQKPRLSWKDEY